MSSNRRGIMQLQNMLGIEGQSGPLSKADSPGVGAQMWVISWQLKARGERRHFDLGKV